MSTHTSIQKRLLTPLELRGTTSSIIIEAAQKRTFICYLLFSITFIRFLSTSLLSKWCPKSQITFDKFESMQCSIFLGAWKMTFQGFFRVYMHYSTVKLHQFHSSTWKKFQSRLFSYKSKNPQKLPNQIFSWKNQRFGAEKVVWNGVKLWICHPFFTP